MVTVKYYPDKHELKMKGHAMKAEKGKDPVCAAISMVYYNLCAMLRNYPAEAFKEEIKMQASEDGRGTTLVSCRPSKSYETWIDHDFVYALMGFEQLMFNFPDAIELKVLQH